jgi:hypothetical protein
MVVRVLLEPWLRRSPAQRWGSPGLPFIKQREESDDVDPISVPSLRKCDRS